jgi:pyruvyl transferase EpsO
MNFSEKKELLKKIITDTLMPLIDNDYWLLGLPYYANIGDVLIWQGTEDFLDCSNTRCKYKASNITYKPQKINDDTIIILQGGGNFGDLWPEQNDFRRKIIKAYQSNKIIILPQTLFYSDPNNLKYDAELFSRHPNITICARDKNSYQLLKKYFVKNTVLLVPDMAFCISMGKLKKHESRGNNKAVFIKRGDKEMNKNIHYDNYFDKEKMDIHDWPPVERRMACPLLLSLFIRIDRRIPFLFPTLTDIYASSIFKSAMIRQGVKFITKYEKVYTTRLHAAILCCLMKKPFVFFDNSYGKNKSFYETWLNDLDNAEFY